MSRTANTGISKIKSSSCPQSCGESGVQIGSISNGSKAKRLGDRHRGGSITQQGLEELRRFQKEIGECGDCSSHDRAKLPAPQLTPVWCGVSYWAFLCPSFPTQELGTLWDLLCRTVRMVNEVEALVIGTGRWHTAPKYGCHHGGGGDDWGVAVS